jgi:hypothetical protein
MLGDIDLARHIVRTDFRCTRELQEVLYLLKGQLPQQLFDAYAHGTASAIASIGSALSNKVLAEYPELEDEIDASIAKYARYL